MVSEIRQQLEAQIGSDRMELWFGDESSLKINGTALKVTAADEFSLDRIRTTYTADLAKVSAHLGFADVEFSVELTETPTTPCSTAGNAKTAGNAENTSGRSGAPAVSILMESENPAQSLSSRCSAEGNDRFQSEMGQADMFPAKQAGDQEVVTAPGSKTGAPTNGPNAVKRAPTVPKESFSGLNRPQRPHDARQSQDARRSQDAIKAHRKHLRDFIVDKENELVWQACHQVLQSPGELTPFFVSGPPGSGKSHLLEGISHVAKQRSRSGKVQYLTAEQFTSDFIGSIKNRSMPMFRKKYRELDYLIVDDLQFLDGKQSTLVELQHTIETHDLGMKPLILTVVL